MTNLLLSFDDFVARQSCDYITTKTAIDPRSSSGHRNPSRIVWQNGALATGEGKFDPPADPAERATLQLEYVTHKLKREVEDWNRYRNACLEQANLHSTCPHHCPPPPSDAPTKLKEGAERIKDLRTQRKKLAERLQSLGVSDQKAENDRRFRELNAEVAERAARVESLVQEIRQTSLSAN